MACLSGVGQSIVDGGRVVRKPVTFTSTVLKFRSKHFWLNARHFSNRVSLVQEFSGVFDLEYTVLKTLTGAEGRLHEQGVSL